MPTEHDLRQSLDYVASQVHQDVDLARLHKQIRRRRRRRHAAAAVAIAVTVSASALAVQSLGALDSPDSQEAAPSGSHSVTAGATTPTPTVKVTGSSWIPGYRTVKEREQGYSLDYRESTEIRFSFRLRSQDEAVAITMDKESASGTFLHCELMVNGRNLGRCSDIATRGELLNSDRTQLIGDPFVIQDLSRRLGWADLGIAPGDQVRVRFGVEYITPAPSYKPQHTSGTLTVGVYEPAE
jgi:hypothetical protein